MLLVQGRREIVFPPVVLLHQSATDILTDFFMLVQGRFGMAFLPAVTAVLLHPSDLDTWTDFSNFSSGQKVICGSTCSYSITVATKCYEYMVCVMCCVYRVE
jgi:hypothetical protein